MTTATQQLAPPPTFSTHLGDLMEDYPEFGDFVHRCLHGFQNRSKLPVSPQIGELGSCIIGIYPIPYSIAPQATLDESIWILQETEPQVVVRVLFPSEY